MGRCKYEEKVKPYLEQIGDWYQMWSEEHIAKQLGVSYTAWKGYKKKYPELMQVLADAQKKLVNELKKSLKMKAKGYEYEEYKITVKEVGGEEVSRTTETYKKRAHPDAVAIHMLLKNLDPEWHNDDQTTIDLKRRQLEIAEKKAEDASW